MSKKIICLFDVDGTLTEPRQPISSNIEKFLLETVKKEFDIAVVGGSDLNKIQEQLGEENLFEKYKYVFAENGLIAFKNGKALPSQSIQNMLGEDILQDFINFVLRYISELKLPMKRGTFVEFRTGIVNISPIGRNCSRKEREQFFEYDSEHHIREKFIQALKKEFPDLPLTYSIAFHRLPWKEVDDCRSRRSLLKAATMITVYRNPSARPNWSPIWATTSFLATHLPTDPSSRTRAFTISHVEMFT
ncbi:phosphomannomutase 2 isoform X2 [Anoplolepis gracilipes]|uniref:phosphomannomutase 2 isoform X2 n=1 Tax=Anoplolepis gracilipes TaxID=354296 RepID=UPI003BA2472C